MMKIKGGTGIPFSPLPSFSVQHLFFLTNNLCEIALLSNLAYFSTVIFSQVFNVSQASFVFFFLAAIVNIIVSGYSTPLFLTMWQSLDGIETSLQITMEIAIQPRNRQW